MEAFFCISDVRTTFPVNDVLATVAVVVLPPMAAIRLVLVPVDSLPLAAELVISVDFLLAAFTAVVLMLGLMELLVVGLTTLRVLSTFPDVVALLFPTTFLLFVSTTRLFVMPLAVGVTLEVVVAGLLFCLLLAVDLVEVDVVSPPWVVVLRLCSIFDLEKSGGS